MCGIVGYIDCSRNSDAEWMSSTAQAMARAIQHRGPDDAGVWVDPDAGVAFGHRRLSIIDLSALGRQPMISASGRYIMVYNGEVYNFQEIRTVLEELGHAFRGKSDTEVILAAVEQWGLEQALSRFVGMFALALWDQIDRRLFLVRDRLGIKPLYYGWAGSVFLFASELKALRVHPAWQGDIDRNNLALYLRYNYVPAPYSIYKGIYTLPPGTFLNLDPNRVSRASFSPFSNEVEEGFTCQPQTWWSAKAVYQQAYRNPFQGTSAEAVSCLEDLLLESVQCRMISDVPLGGFLSGGVDSSAVVALMQAQSQRPIRTFTIGFREAVFNEAPYAQAVAEYLGTDHTEQYVTPEMAMTVIPNLPDLYDEPFADSSQIPTFLISALARQQVTVCLSGDGGDELFSGYNRYHQAPWLWSKMRRIPPSIRLQGQKLLTGISLSTWDKLFRYMKPLLPGMVRGRIPGDIIYKVADILSAHSPYQVYHHLTSQFKDPSRVVVEGCEPPEFFTQSQRHLDVNDFTKWMMFADLVTYHPDDILVKLDRASMGVSLESRIPLIDHRVVEFMATIPKHLLLQNGKCKWLLRQVLYKYVPASLIERPKMGFGIPIGLWLRGPLKDWGAALLDETRLKQEGLLNPRPIRRMWREHLSGQRDWQYRLWVILMFQAWRERWK